MKKYLLILTVCLAAVSCKKRLEEPVVLTVEQIKIGVKGGNVSTDMDVFEIGDNIGIYTIAKDDDTEFSKFIHDNYGYTFNMPYWEAMSVNHIMFWSDDDPSLYMYAYHPYKEDDGSDRNVQITANDVLLNYSLPLDQSNINSKIKNYDLMRSVDKGVNGQGLHKMTMNGNPVQLKFNHKLCKLQFNIKVIKPIGLNVVDDKAYLTNITIEGSQIASHMNMSLKNGNTTVSGFGSKVQWNGNLEIPVGTDFNSATSVFVSNMLLIPFEQVEDENVIKFKIKFKGEQQQDVVHVLTARIKEPTSPSDLTFYENQYNKMTVHAKLSGADEIKIITTIVDWDSSDHEISPM